jgi:Fe-S cluster assembly protein SufD
LAKVKYHKGVLQDHAGSKQEIEFRPIDKSEPQWLYDLRRQAWDYYRGASLPMRIVHLWKYTKPEWFLPEDVEQQMNILPKRSEVGQDQIAPLKPGFAGFGCNHGNRVIYSQLAKELADTGVIFKDMSTAIDEHGELLQKYLGRLVGPDFGKFEALNLALFNHGMFLYVPPNLTIEEPIFVHRHPNKDYSFMRLLVVVGENSQVTIVDEYADRAGADRFKSSNVVELYADKSSRVRYLNPQNLSGSVTSFLTQRARIEQEAQIWTIFASLGSEISKSNLGTILNGRGASSQMLGVAFADDRQHFDHHTRHQHTAGESYSNIDFKIVLKDQARSAYTGLIRIEEETTNCQAYQENRNLLLNPGASAESIPELEILNDQVSCSHGATVGPLDSEMIFYLKSRGISTADAVRMIVMGFVEPLLNLMPADIRQFMENLVRFKLENRNIENMNLETIEK